MTSDKTTTIQKLRDEHKIFIKERNWHKYQDPKSIAVSISIEANELLELFQWDSVESGAKKVLDLKWREKIEGELADVFIYLIDFANETGIDLSKVFEKKMKSNREKFKVEEMVSIDAYHKVKEDYRKNRK